MNGVTLGRNRALVGQHTELTLFKAELVSGAEV